MYKYLLATVFLAVVGLLVVTDSAQAQKGKGGGGGGKGGTGAGRPAPSPGRPNNVPYRGVPAVGGYYRSPSIGIGIGVYSPFYPYPTYGYGYDPYYYSPRYSYYPPPTVIIRQPEPDAPVSNSATIRVLVPDADAKVWVDGAATKQTGTDRYFHTPDLEPGGLYTYRIRAEWSQKGERMIQEQVVPVAPGRTSMADFTRPFSEELPPPPPAK